MSVEFMTKALTGLIAQWRQTARAFDRLLDDLEDRLKSDPTASGDRRTILEAQRDAVEKLRDRCDLTTGFPDTEGEIQRLTALIAELRVKSFALPQQRYQEIVKGYEASLDKLLKNGPAVGGVVPLAVLPQFEAPVYQLVGGKLKPLLPATGGFGPPPDTPGRLVADPLDVINVLYVQLARERLDDHERYIVDQVAQIQETISDIGQYLNIYGVRRGVEDLGAYPVLTREVDGFGGGPGYSSTSPAAGGTGLLQRTVDAAFRDVLGRVPRVRDYKAFVAALNQSYSVAEVNGKTVVTYSPRTFSGQAELGGGVTGAQASLYARASVSLEKALPLLDGLTPLTVTADKEDADAVRAIIRQELAELGAELKLEGGPRPARVDGLLAALFGVETDRDVDVSPVYPQGQFGELAKEYGFNDQRRINTLDEEANASNFLAVFDFAAQIRQGWLLFREHFQGKDLGTRLVLLSRALSVTAEAVDEVYAAMDSVFVGPAERQVASFTPPGANRPVLVAEVLTWVTTFTTDEAPRLVHDGGRKGVLALQPTAIRLEGLVRQLIDALPSDPGLPAGMRHARVRFPLQELQGYLNQIQQLAEDVRKPLRGRA